MKVFGGSSLTDHRAIRVGACPENEKACFLWIQEGCLCWFCLSGFVHDSSENKTKPLQIEELLAGFPVTFLRAWVPVMKLTGRPPEKPLTESGMSRLW